MAQEGRSPCVLTHTPLPGPSWGGQSCSLSWGVLWSPWAVRGGAAAWRAWFSLPSLLSPTGDSLSLEARRPSLFPPALSLVVLKALPAGGPPPRPALPQHSAWGVASFRNHPPRCFISALTPTPGLLAAFWGQHNQGWVSLGISFFKMPEGARFSLNPHSSPSFQTWVGAVLGGTPDTLL